MAFLRVDCLIVTMVDHASIMFSERPLTVSIQSSCDSGNTEVQLERGECHPGTGRACITTYMTGLLSIF